MKIINKIKARLLLLASSSFLFLAKNMIVLSAKDESTASAKLKKTVTDAGSDLKSFLTTVGTTIASLISGITGVVALAIGIMAIWDITRNNGQNEIWSNHSTKFFWLIGIAALAGLIAAAFNF